jgi:hypothetical protein
MRVAFAGCHVPVGSGPPHGLAPRGLIAGCLKPGSDETVSLNREAVLKRIPAINDHDQQRGSIMVAFILNAIYRRFLRSALPGMRRFPGAAHSSNGNVA